MSVKELAAGFVQGVGGVVALFGAYLLAPGFAVLLFGVCLLALGWAFERKAG